VNQVRNNTQRSNHRL